MPVLFVIFGLASLAALAVLAGSIILGIVLCLSKRFKTAGVFVLFVPTLVTIAAVFGSWGLAVLLDRLSRSAASPEAWQRYQVLTLWAWPIGFVGGAVLGGIAGVLIALLIVKRRGNVVPQAA